MNDMKKIIFLCLLVGLLSSCENKDDNRTGIKQISYGLSFGECIGYCKYEMILRRGFSTFIQSGWNDTIETITCAEPLTAATWESFKDGFDPDKFLDFPEIIGCPDCADGGAEWVEFEFSSGKKHRVTFEYMNEPEKLKDFVSELRKHNSESTHCEEY